MSIFSVKQEKLRYTDVSRLSSDYTDRMDRMYNWLSRIYDLSMFIFPIWKVWIKRVIPHITGSKILEVSFGTGYLMTRYASDAYELYGVDYNKRMIRIATRKMQKKGINATLLEGNVEQLPFPDQMFDTVINTMAFTGYPDGDKAMAEIKRVLKDDGTLLMVGFDYPVNRNLFGYLIMRLIEKMGDVLKDLHALFDRHNLACQEYTIGGFGSIHLFIVHKKDS